MVTKVRSYCVKCGHTLGARDLVPLLSFIFLRGHCRFCKNKISWQYPLVELATGILFVLIAYQSGVLVNGHWLLAISHWLGILRGWIFVSFLIIIFVYDLRYYLIIDKVTIPAMVAAIILNLIMGVLWWQLLLGAVVGGGFFWLQYVVSRRRWIGGGDIRLGILMGLMLGWPGILLALFLAYVIGGAVGLILIISKIKTLKSAVPFGTFLSVATAITLLYGEKIIIWYLELIR